MAWATATLPARLTRRLGHYHAEAWDDATKTYQTKADVGVFVSVEETFDNNHRIVAQRGASKGKFTFSAADSGQHRICLMPQNVPSGSSWLGSAIHGTVRFTLDLAIGETSRIESTDKDKVETLVQKVQDLNSRLQDIRREQVFQRVGWSYPLGPHARLTHIHRSARLSFVTSQSTQTRASSDGPSSSSSSSPLRACGNYRICAPFSSSKSSREACRTGRRRRRGGGEEEQGTQTTLAHSYGVVR